MTNLFETGRMADGDEEPLVRSATCEWMCDPEGRPAALIDLYARLARGGVGVIIASCAHALSARGRGGPPRIYADTTSTGCRRSPRRCTPKASRS